MKRYNKSSSKMPIILLLVLIIALIIYIPKLNILSNNKTFSKLEIEAIVRDTIANSPESIISSLEKYQNKKNNEEVERLKKNVSEKKDQLEDSRSPSNNSQNSDVTIIEFFDYNCGYCKRASHALAQAIIGDSKVKIIFKEFPILGENSFESAKTALAINKISSEKYMIFHDKLMSSKNIDKIVLDDLVSKLSINKDELDKIKSSSDIAEEITSNKNLAHDLGINGTPAFIINGEVISGAIDTETFKDHINKIRLREKK